MIPIAISSFRCMRMQIPSSGVAKGFKCITFVISFCFIYKCYDIYLDTKFISGCIPSSRNLCNVSYKIKWEKAISFQPQVFDLWHLKRSLANVILRKFMQVYNSLFMMWHYNLSLRHYFGVELFPVIWTTTIKDVITQRIVDETSREEETRQVTIYKCNYCRNMFLRNFVLKDA